MYLPNSNQYYHRIVQIRYYLLVYYPSNLVNCLLDKLVPQTYILIYYIGLKGKTTSSPQLFKSFKYRKPPISSLHSPKGVDVYFSHTVLTTLRN